MQRIEISGGIAAGKTTLARALAAVGYHAVFEDFRSNPFWAAFYENPKAHAFETEIAFVLQHYHYIKTKGHGVTATDFSFLLDLAYARIGLSGARLDIFERLLRQVLEEVSPPDLKVVLRCPAAVEWDRIRERGRAEEKTISIDWLETLNEEVESVARACDAGDTIWIDSADLDFREEQPGRGVATGLVMTAWRRLSERSHKPPSTEMPD